MGGSSFCFEMAICGAGLALGKVLTLYGRIDPLQQCQVQLGGMGQVVQLMLQ